jgi:hypothetical protein
MAKANDKKKAKKDPKKAKPAAESSSVAIRLSDHPRAAVQVRTWRAIGGIAGLALAAYAAHGGGLAPFDVGLRALVGGLAGSLIAWTVAVVVWRQVVVAEVRAARNRLLAEAERTVEA